MRTPIPRTLDGILAHTVADGSCRLWAGAASGEPRYGYVWMPDRPTQRKVHRMVAAWTYGPPPSDKPEVLHSCDRPLCIEPTHLRYGTQADNVEDMMTRGRRRQGALRYGEAHPMTRISAADACEIVRRYAGGESAPALGEVFGVSSATAWNIATGRTWAHLSDELQDEDA